jgi:TorA maturation chaperone TorD
VTDFETEVDHILARIVLCRTVKLGLRPPGRDGFGLLFSEEGRRVLREAAALMGEPVQSAAEALAVSNGSSPAAAAARHAELFGRAGPGSVCLHESGYTPRGRFQRAWERADPARYLRAFGLEPSPESGERTDHIAVELDFVEFLACREIHALAADDAGMLEKVRAIYRSFLRDHLGGFGRAIARRLSREDDGGLYGAFGKLCEELLRSECRRLGVADGPAQVPCPEGRGRSYLMYNGSSSESHW